MMSQGEKIQILALPGGRRAVLKAAKGWRQGALAFHLHQIRSPSLPRCFGISSLDGRPGFKDLPLVFLESPPTEAQILVEYLEGVSLRDFPREDLLPDRLMAWLDQLLEALAWLMKTSDRPFVHLDISPENIIIGPHDRAALIDFSGAFLIDGKEDSPDLPLYGKKGYTAPEVYEGQISPAADLYSLAMSFLSLLAGKPASQLDRKDQARVLGKLDHPLGDILATFLKEVPPERFEGVRGQLYRQTMDALEGRQVRPGSRQGARPDLLCPYLVSDCPLLDLARKLSG